jgi:uncharacterized repeat protein (TIGR01451 family)
MSKILHTSIKVRHCCGAIAMLTLSLFASAAFAVGTAAGSNIANTATVTFVHAGGGPQTVTSNTSNIRVDEVLNVAIASINAGQVAVNTPDADRQLSFRITNTGNGQERFNLTATTTLAGDQFDPTFDRIVLDANGNGLFDAGTDTHYVAGTNDPILNADQSLMVFLVSDIPGALNSGDVGDARLTVTAATGSGAPGTTFPGQGTGGGDALVGFTTASGNSQNGYIVSQVSTTFSKAQAVTDPSGGSNPVSGATITYTLTLDVNGSGALSNGIVSDPIPANTTYAANSIRLNGAPLTDAADADAARFTGAAIEVNLGTLNPPASHAITFQVRIN